MAKRGRKPLPAEEKRRRGNPGKRKLPKKPTAKEAAARVAPTPPEHLTGPALEEWNRLGTMLADSERWDAKFQTTFAAYCVAFGRWQESETVLREKGFVVKAPSGFPIQNPYLAVANKAMEQMRKFLSELGLTPASHAEHSPTGTPDDEDPFLAMLKARAGSN